MDEKGIVLARCLSYPSRLASPWHFAAYRGLDAAAVCSPNLEGPDASFEIAARRAGGISELREAKLHRRAVQGERAVRDGRSRGRTARVDA
jgi:hypothetical protein